MGSAGEPSPLRPWIETPLIESASFSRAAGCRIFLKLENLQPSGSFKSRGIGNLVLQHVNAHRLRNQSSSSHSNSPPRGLHFFSSSGGNAGLACVTAARALGFPASVVVPLSTKAHMIAKIKTAGATQVMQQGTSWAEADAFLRDVVLEHVRRAGKEEPVYVPPFDDPRIWDGAATLVAELAHQLPEGPPPDAIVCSVGGGGLFCGVMQALDNMGWAKSTKVLACETQGAESLARSLEARELITLPAITSLATSLGARRVCKRAFEYGQRENVSSVVMSDAEACMGSCHLADDERLIVEPACGVSVACCYQGRLKGLVKGLSPEGRVVVVVCGGANVSSAMLGEWKERFGGELI